MFPILPILILLLMGPANAERLAVEGRLPSVLLAAHRAMADPVCATVVAPAEEEPTGTPTVPGGKRPRVHPDCPIPPRPKQADGFNPANPTRAGPQVA